MINPQTITVAGVTFDNIDYDAEADALYLHVGDPASAVDFDESPEGHHLRFDASGGLVGITIVGARQDLKASGKVVVTVPERVEIDPRLLGVITSAA